MLEKNKSPKQSKRRWGLWILLVSLALPIIGVVGAYIWIYQYLRSDALRERLEETLGQNLEAQEVSLSSIRWDGWKAQSQTLDISKQALKGSPLTQLNAQGAEIEFDPTGLRERTWRLRGGELRHLHLEFANSSEIPAQEVQAPSSSEAEQESSASETTPWWMPNQLDFGQVNIARLSGQWQSEQNQILCSWDDIRVSVQATEGQEDHYAIKASGGQIQSPLIWLPELRLKQAQAHSSPEGFWLNEAEFDLFEFALLSLQGEQNAQRGLSMQATLEDLSLKEVLPATWHEKLQGQADLEFFLSQPPEQSLILEGSCLIQSAWLTQLDELKLLANYLNNPRLERLFFQQARAEFRYQDGQLELWNIEATSPAVASFRGKLTIRPDQSLEGQIQLGVVPGLLSSIPGAETQVFTRREGGMLWTSVELSGSLQNLKENLTQRLIFAAGERILTNLPEGSKFLMENSGELLEQGKQAVQQALPEPMSLIDQVISGQNSSTADLLSLEKGVDAVEQATELGSGVIEQGGNAIEQLLRVPFGGRSQED